MDIEVKNYVHLSGQRDFSFFPMSVCEKQLSIMVIEVISCYYFLFLFCHIYYFLHYVWITEASHFNNQIINLTARNNYLIKGTLKWTLCMIMHVMGSHIWNDSDDFTVLVTFIASS